MTMGTEPLEKEDNSSKSLVKEDIVSILLDMHCVR